VTVSKHAILPQRRDRLVRDFSRLRIFTPQPAIASRMRLRPASMCFVVRSPAMRLPSLFAAALAIMLIAGCQTTPPAKATAGTPVPAAAPAPSPPRQPAANPATKAAATKANLAIEKLRLAELFRGTPVLFVLQPDGSMRADVPLQFSFDAGRSVVKPPLAAVLDRIAAGQRDESTHVVVHAPGDAAGKALAGERAASMRDHLVARGLADARVTVAPPAGATVVRVIVADAAPM
jgi:outer membrane protein OmpA-like peptidoglycan-associated protein